MPEVRAETVIDGRYRIVRRLGSGGMADVYLAEDINLGRQVAVKILHQRFAQDSEFVERFKREAKAAAALQHPNVVAIYDRGDYDGTYYIAMEYLRGRSLKSIVERDAPLDWQRAIKITKQILAAIGYAHRHNIVHRDIKPHNVVIDDNDGVKVMDFGIARAGSSQITEVGSIIGTAQYLSPEQAQGQTVSEASDLYSVGVVLYEMLTGVVPFSGDTAVTIALKHVSENAQPVQNIVSTVPKPLGAVVEKALEKDCDDRFATAAAFSEVLERVEASLSSDAVGADTAVWDAIETKTKKDRQTESQDKPTKAKKTELKAKRENLAVASTDGERPKRRRGLRFWLPIGLLIAAVAAAATFFLLKPEQVVVPTVIGQDVEDARSTLERSDLTVGVRRVDSPVAVGLVIEQSPIARDRVDKGSTVLLTVSKGPGSTVMPDLKGQGEVAAKALLKKRGFKVEVEKEDSKDVREGLVVRTEPDTGESVAVGSQVTLFVSAGPAEVELPNVVGLRRDDAVARLKEEGLSVVVDRVDSSEDEDVVTKQSPSAGSKVDENASITISVSNGNGAKVPSVVGLTSGDASFNLKQAGFEVALDEQITDQINRDNIVLSQDPSQGTNRTKGATVTITVGKFEATGVE